MKTPREKWELEWMVELPADANGERNWDRAVYACRCFPTRALALAFAAKALPGRPMEAGMLTRLRQVSAHEAAISDQDVFPDGGIWWERLEREEVTT